MVWKTWDQENSRQKHWPNVVRNHPHPTVPNLIKSHQKGGKYIGIKKIIKNDCSAMTITGDVFRKYYLQGKELLVDKIRAPLLSRGIFNILAIANMFSMIQKSILMTDRLS